MKRIALILVIALFYSISFAQTELVLWHGFASDDSRLKSLENEIGKYQQNNGDIKVKLVYAGNPDGFEPKLNEAFSNGTYPDLLWWGPQATGKMAKSGKLVKVQDFINNDKDFNKKDIYDGLWEVSKYRGEIWTVPFDANNLAIYYNKDMFANAQIDPRDIKTWTDLKKAAMKLTKDENGDGTPEVYGFMIPYGDSEWTVWSWQTLLWQSGGEFLGGPEKKETQFYSFSGIKSLKFWVEMLYNKIAYNCDENMGWNPQDFLNGKTAMMINGPWNYKALSEQKKINYGAIFLPADLRKATNIGGENLYIFKSDKNKEAKAWEFAKYIMSPEFQVNWSMETGYLPVCDSANKNETYREFMNNNEFIKTYVEQMRYGKARPSIPEYTNISSYLGKQIKRALNMEIAAEEALRLAERYSTEILKTK